MSTTTRTIASRGVMATATSHLICKCSVFLLNKKKAQLRQCKPRVQWKEIAIERACLMQCVAVPCALTAASASTALCQSIAATTFTVLFSVLLAVAVSAYGNESLLAIPFFIFLALLTVLGALFIHGVCDCVCVFIHVNMFSELRFAKCQ